MWSPFQRVCEKLNFGQTATSYPGIQIHPLEELHSKFVLPVDKLANFSEPLVWADLKGTLDEDENDDNPSLADISRDWKYEKLELDQRYKLLGNWHVDPFLLS